MIDPLQFSPAIAPLGEAARGAPASAPAPAGKDFQSYLTDRLNEVSRLQEQADVGVRNLMTGQADNVTEVLSAVKKAEVAFSLMMEIRNKLVDAYAEIRQMRV